MSSTISEISSLINKGKFRSAAQLSEAHVRDSQVNQSAHFYFQWGLARKLAGLDSHRQFESAKTCGDYSYIMEGDLNRDMALSYARDSDFDKAMECLEYAKMLFEADDNRLASIEMVRGRIAYFQGDFEEADICHCEASAQWMLTETGADQQWILNNRFHWLRARARMGVDTTHQYHDFRLSGELRRDRLFLAFLYQYFGKWGVYLGDALERV